ncbi:serine--tRNA ligase [Oscillospiraceae bacterium MB08-C2-2]|nr:serine--tRNA ligase [Oscillospiraceae bacterium MB08-C2-2]
MLDIKRIRTNPQEVKEAVGRRGADVSAQVDEIIEIDRQRREISAKADAIKAEQNKASKEIPAMKKAGQDTTELMARMKELSDEVKVLDEAQAGLSAKQDDILYSIPNAPHSSVPDGLDDSQNVEVRRVGTPREFDFEIKAHWDIGADLNILDPETAGKVTGARFHFYRGLGARLERAVINFYLNSHSDNGYTEIFPPFMANRASMTGTGQLPKFGDDMFKLEGLDYYLIPTAEVPVTNMHRDEILDGTKLPIKYCAYSACFRKEGGSAGRDTRGLIRQHQFNKVELVKFASPEDSYNQLEQLTADAEAVLTALGLPFRTVALCAGDLGFSSAKTYDIEVWMPSYGRYLEISSCSNFEDFQARRAAIRFKNTPKDKAQLVHTLNGSGVAVGRTVAAILENYQNDDGSVTIPKALVPYMGTEVISAAR